MKRFKLPAWLMLIFLGAGVLWPLNPAQLRAQTPKTPARLLVVTHSAGFKHAVVNRKQPDALSLVEQIVQKLGKDSGAFETTFIYSAEDCRNLTLEVLRAYDGVFFYTTGDVPFPDETKTALIEFVQSGKAFVGVHSATDTYYNFPAYGEMIGGFFDGHPWHQQVVIKVEDKSHPACRHLGEKFQIHDEIYQFREPWSRGNVNVLLSLDSSSVDVNKKGVKRTDKDFALAWTRTHGEGRVFYTALGHGEKVWNDERFQQHLQGGILWTLNLEQA